MDALHLHLLWLAREKKQIQVMWFCGNTQSHLLSPPKFLCVLAELRAALTLVVVDTTKVIDQAKSKSQCILNIGLFVELERLCMWWCNLKLQDVVKLSKNPIKKDV